VYPGINLFPTSSRCTNFSVTQHSVECSMFLSVHDKFSLAVKLCMDACQDKKNRARDNYSLDWKCRPASLLNQLFAGKYHRPNDYIFLIENEELIAGAGFYRYTEDVALCMTRLFVLPEYKHQGRAAQLLAYQLDLMRSLGCKKAWITFNDYNKPLYDAFVQDRDGFRMKMFPDLWREFTPIGKRVINNVEQYCCECSLLPASN
jgi:GNAT superfamily N-acetyltransferase